MNKENYSVSHKEVQGMVREFMLGWGYKVITKQYHKKLYKNTPSYGGAGLNRYDDVFAHKVTDEKIVCEYKPTPITKYTVMVGFGQVLCCSVETNLRCYLVICEDEFLEYTKELDCASWIGFFIYDTGKKIKYWRKPINLMQLPEPNKIQEV